MKLGLVGPSYQERSLPFDAQRTINLYPTLDETGQGKEPAALYGTPGLAQFATAGVGPIRAEFSSANGRAFAVSGDGFYEVLSDGTTALHGSLDTGTSICSVVENTTQLSICDGESNYVLKYSDNTFAKVTDSDFPVATTVTFQDQYTIVSKASSGSFYISAQGDSTSWTSLDFATAESSPDNLVRVYSAYGQLWLFGETTTEVWYNSGDATFPFTRVEGAKMQIGCASPHSVVDLDNSLFWIGKNKDGTGIVYMAQGYTAIRVSTYALEKILGKIEDLTLLRAYSYEEDGHLFYVITGNGLSTSWAYDVATKQWHERAYLEEDGSFSTHRAATHMFAFGKHLVGDKATGAIYEMSLDYFDDDGSALVSQRTFTHLHDENKPFSVNELQIDFETGVGLTTGQGSDPQVWLEVSRDGGRTWGPKLQASIGALGKYRTRAVWRRLGLFHMLTVRVSISDPVKRAICGAYMQ